MLNPTGKALEAIRRELEADRIESARFRRTMEDLLFNLDEENMPQVDRRIRESEDRIALVVGEDENGKDAVRASIIVEAINDTSDVAITADRINLNGAVTANENFRIHEDGSVSCRQIEITGGRINLPDPGDGEPLIRVFSDALGGVISIYADRLRFDGEPLPGSYTISAELNAEQLTLRQQVADPDGTQTERITYLRPGEYRQITNTTGTDSASEEESIRLSSSGICAPRIYHTPVPDTDPALRPLYIDENGYIRALAT